jgi:hypothetical protein
MRLSIQVFGSLTIMCVVVAGASLAQADSVELVNGDVLNGKVVSLDDRELRLTSDIHGELTIRRDKVAAIGLGDRKITRPAAAADRASGRGGANNRPNAAAGDQASTSLTVPVAPGSVEDVVRQLRAQGLNVEQVGNLQKELPLLKEPGVKKYFDETVSGLMKGDINVSDVRKDAIRVREEYRKTAKSLGPEGERTLNQALGGYLQILDNFIRETEPKSTDERPAIPPANGRKQDSVKEQSKAAEKSEPRR